MHSDIHLESFSLEKLVETVLRILTSQHKLKNSALLQCLSGVEGVGCTYRTLTTMSNQQELEK